MKKIYYLMGVVAAAALASCHPMSSTYKTLDENPAPGSITYTLQSADYKLVSKSVDTLPAKTLAFSTVAQAKADIPSILNYKFYKYGNGSKASITYRTGAYLTQPDSLYQDLAYTLVNSDYLLLPKNTYPDFSASQTIQWIPYKYPAPATANQQYVFTLNYYNGSATVANTNLAIAFIGGAWMQIYLITPAEYAAFGRGAHNEFVSSDAANIPTYINGILKTDPTVAAIAQTGVKEYVSFNYYVGGKDYQRIIQMQYDGANWNPVNFATVAFIKSGGTWIPDPTIYYTLTAADCQLIANSNIGGTALANARTNLGKYDDFEVQSGFTTDLINQAIILVLQNDFANPTPNVPYSVTYQAYTSKDNAVSALFIYDGSKWVAQQ